MECQGSLSLLWILDGPAPLVAQTRPCRLCHLLLLRHRLLRYSHYSHGFLQRIKDNFAQFGSNGLHSLTAFSHSFASDRLFDCGPSPHPHPTPPQVAHSAEVSGSRIVGLFACLFSLKRSPSCMSEKQKSRKERLRCWKGIFWAWWKGMCFSRNPKHHGNNAHIAQLLMR